MLATEAENRNRPDALSSIPTLLSAASCVEHPPGSGLPETPWEKVSGPFALVLPAPARAPWRKKQCSQTVAAEPTSPLVPAPAP